MITVTSTQELAMLLNSNLKGHLELNSSIRFYIDDKLVDFVSNVNCHQNKLYCSGLRESDYSSNRVYNMRNFEHRKVRFDIVLKSEETLSQEDAIYEPYIDIELGY